MHGRYNYVEATFTGLRKYFDRLKEAYSRFQGRTDSEGPEIYEMGNFKAY